MLSVTGDWKRQPLDEPRPERGVLGRLRPRATHYLAVTVRDESSIVGHASHLDTDAVEVYVDGVQRPTAPFPPTAEGYEAIDPARSVAAIRGDPGKGLI